MRYRRLSRLHVYSLGNTYGAMRYRKLSRLHPKDPVAKEVQSRLSKVSLLAPEKPIGSCESIDRVEERRCVLCS